MEITELVTQDTSTLPAVAVVDVQIERATYIADKLAEIVTSRNWFADIQGKRYLEVEAWQFIGFQSGLDSDIEYTEPVYDGDNIVAYKSKAVLLRNGIQVASGIMECGMDSFPTQGKQGREKHKAAQSASQTWAISKSYRNKLSFIAKMAGFEPTPADEMRTTSEPRGQKGESLKCPIHKGEVFFKSGRMSDYAHVVDGEQGPRGGKKWCNQPEAIAKAASTPRQDSTQEPQEGPPEPQGAVDQESGLVSPQSVGDVYTFGRETLRFKDKAQMDSVLGSLTQYGTYGDMQDRLADWMEKRNQAAQDRHDLNGPEGA